MIHCRTFLPYKNFGNESRGYRAGIRTNGSAEDGSEQASMGHAIGRLSGIRGVHDLRKKPLIFRDKRVLYAQRRPIGILALSPRFGCGAAVPTFWKWGTLLCGLGNDGWRPDTTVTGPTFIRLVDALPSRCQFSRTTEAAAHESEGRKFLVDGSDQAGPRLIQSASRGARVGRSFQQREC